MGRIRFFLTLMVLLIFPVTSFSSTILPSYTPEKYNLMKPLSKPYPIKLKLLKNRDIVKRIIMKGMLYSTNHPDNITNYINIMVYSYIYWDLSSQGTQRNLASKIGLDFAKKAYKIRPDDPLIKYLKYVFEDLNSVSYREINGASKVLKIIRKYKDLINNGQGCVFAGGPYRNLARTYYKISAIFPAYSDRAIDTIVKALKCKDKFSMNYLILGDIYLLKGEPEKAKKIYDQIKKLKPNNYMAKLYQEADYWTAQWELKLYKEGKWNIRTDWVYDRGGWWENYNN